MRFAGRGDMQRQRVNAAGQFVGERRVDHAMTLDAALAGEGPRHDMNAEMRLTAGPVAGMTLVAMGFVNDFDPFGSEGGGEFPSDDFLGAHETGA